MLVITQCWPNESINIKLITITIKTLHLYTILRTLPTACLTINMTLL